MLALVSLAVLFAPVVVTGDLDTAYQKLKDATAGKDVVQVKILAAQTCALAREAISAVDAGSRLSSLGAAWRAKGNASAEDQARVHTCFPSPI